MTEKTESGIVEVNLGMLQIIDEADRSEWDEDMYISAGEETGKIKYYSQWTLGKLAYEFANKWGDVKRYSRDIHVDTASIYAYRRVYKKIYEKDPTYVPDGYIPWGVLQIAAETDEPIQMIEELSANNKVSVEEAYRYKKEKETGKTVAKKPIIQLKWNEESGLWKIEMNENDFDKIDWSDVGEKLAGYFKRLWNK